MPAVTVKLLEGVFTPAQKREVIEKITDALVSIEGEHVRPLTLVVIEEIKSGDWGVGGDALTTEAVKSLMAGRRDK